MSHKDTEILYRHFASDHNPDQDFKFQVFSTNIVC